MKLLKFDFSNETLCVWIPAQEGMIKKLGHFFWLFNFLCNDRVIYDVIK